MFAVFDALALVFFALELVHLGVSFLTRRPLYIKAIYRWVDRLVQHRLQQLAWLSFDYAVIRLAVFVWQSDAFGVWQAAAFSVGLLVLCLALFYPLSFAWGLLITPWCAARPLGHALGDCLPAHAGLQANWQTFRDEYRAAATRFGTLPAMHEILKDVSLVDEAAPPQARWTTVFLRVGGRDFPATLRHFPALAAAIDSPRIVGALLSCLEPGVVLKPHRGYFKGFLRYHLCLEVGDPARVWLVVGGQRYHWRAGEAVIFDDAYVHSAHNTSEHSRVVVFLDILRPLPPALDHVNRAIAAYAGWHPFSAVIERQVNHWAARADADV